MRKAVKTHMQKKPVTVTNNRSPFQLHIALISVALVNWRWYIKSLVEQTEDQVGNELFLAVRYDQLIVDRQVESLLRMLSTDVLQVSLRAV